MNHAYRWGASVIETYRPDGSIQRLVYERPTVRREPRPRSLALRETLLVTAGGFMFAGYVWAVSVVAGLAS